MHACMHACMQTDRQTDRHTHTHFSLSLSLSLFPSLPLCTDRSSITFSFFFPPFRVFIFPTYSIHIRRSWHVGFSGPLIFPFCARVFFLQHGRLGPLVLRSWYFGACRPKVTWGQARRCKGVAWGEWRGCVQPEACGVAWFRMQNS